MKKDSTQRTFRIQDLDTLRAVSDPLRVQLVEILAQPHTVKQVAEKLGLASSKLYYHFTTLEKLGLIEVTETRLVANMVEKVYRASAEVVEIDPGLFKFSKEGDNEPLDIVVSSTIDATREDIRRSLQARQFQLGQGAPEQPRRFLLNRVISRLPEDRVTEFQDRLVKLLQEFEAEDTATTGQPGLQPYALTVAFYPSFYFETPKKEKKEKKKK